MGRTLPLRNSNTQTGAQTQRHTCWMFTQVPGGCCAFSRSCATVNLHVVASTGFKMKDIPHQWSPKKKKKEHGGNEWHNIFCYHDVHQPMVTTMDKWRIKYVGFFVLKSTPS